MMNSGMKETTEKMATLNDIEAQIFGLFLEFPVDASTGLASGTALIQVSKLASGHREAQIKTARSLGIGPRTCSQCCKLRSIFSETNDSANHYQFCPMCIQEGLPTAYSCVFCAADIPGFHDVFCTTCIFMKGLTSGDTCKPNATTKAALKSFGEREYEAFNMSHSWVRQYLKTVRPADRVSTKLSAHGKLYVFADMYMVQDLKDLCLLKLHRDILAYDLNEHGLDEVRDLLQHVYGNMVDDEGNYQAGSKSLRDLVINYAACHAEVLVDDEGFEAMLEARGPLAWAFAKYVVKRQT